MQSVIQQSQRLIVKVGSSLVTNEGKGLDHAAIAKWADQIAHLREMGKQVVLVSSGAIAEGMQRLGFEKRPTGVHELQACAAVGQMGLAQIYETSFSTHGLRTAQVLLTHADLADRERYLNARSTLFTLLDFGVVPVINENDTVVTDEIKFGDNDTLGSREQQVLVRLANGEAIGTRLVAQTARLTARKQWMADHLQTAGRVILDTGAVQKLSREGKSLLPIGVIDVSGEFGRGDVITCIDQSGTAIARGISNYSSAEVRRIMRKPSSEIASILGYVEEVELIHRDNLVLL